MKNPTPRAPQTPEMQLDRIVRTVDSMIDRAEREVAKFAERLAENPADAFEWGEDAAEAAAALQVAHWVRRCATAELNEKRTEDDLVNAIREMVLSHVLQGAQFPKNSTSQFANLMDRYTTKAWAGLADLFL